MQDKKPRGKTKRADATEPVCTKDAQPIKIYLAALDHSDCALIRSWRNSYFVWKWCRQTGPISDIEQDNWFRRQAADPSIRMFKVMAQNGEKPQPIGVAGLTSIDWLNRRAEFSLYITPSLQKKGLGMPALHCLLYQAFAHYGLHCVWGETFAGNPAAKMFEKIGFKKEGTRRDFYFREGRFIDAHLYSILEEEWRAINYRST